MSGDSCHLLSIGEATPGVVYLTVGFPVQESLQEAHVCPESLKG